MYPLTMDEKLLTIPFRRTHLWLDHPEHSCFPIKSFLSNYAPTQRIVYKKKITIVNLQYMSSKGHTSYTISEQRFVLSF